MGVGYSRTAWYKHFIGVMIWCWRGVKRLSYSGKDGSRSTTFLNKGLHKGDCHMDSASDPRSLIYKAKLRHYGLSSSRVLCLTSPYFKAVKQSILKSNMPLFHLGKVFQASNPFWGWTKTCLVCIQLFTRWKGFAVPWLLGNSHSRTSQ